MLAALDKSHYIVLLDHQPLAYMNRLVSKNEMVYGIKEIGSTTCIVSSGISEWGFAFRTGCKSEYFVINVNGEKY